MSDIPVIDLLQHKALKSFLKDVREGKLMDKLAAQINKYFEENPEADPAKKEL